MKRGLTFALTILVFTLLFQACEKDGNILDRQDQVEIKKVIDTYVEAFNQHDANKLSSLWAKDANYINLTTQESYEGSDDLTDHFKQQFGEKGAEKLRVKVSTIYFPTPDEAIAKGLAEVDFKDKHLEKSAFLIQYAKENGIWLIKSFSINELNPSLSHFEQLKDINWLAGSWRDEDENIDVEYNYEWDKSKNFLTQHFTLSILGQEQLNGIQMIGWDPIEKKIHSWIFDSDGGFGESTWTKENENTWYSPVVFTLPQGGKATATHVYTKIDDDTYTFASENRDVEGKLLPNIGPFKIVRKK